MIELTFYIEEAPTGNVVMWATPKTETATTAEKRALILQAELMKKVSNPLCLVAESVAAGFQKELEQLEQKLRSKPPKAPN